MNRTISFLLVAVIALSVVGCGTATTPTLAPTQPPQVITVIVTATPPPPTATSSAPTVTPMPTLPLTSTVTTATPTQAVAKATTAPRTPTRTPTQKLAAATATALPMKFGAPNLSHPIWTDNQKDQATFPGGAIVFDWQSVGGLAGDECYLVQATTEPVNPGPGIESSRGDYWVAWCGDQTATGVSVKFTLEPPRLIGAAPNYSSILLNTDQMWANWSVTVVKNLGQCDPSYQYHCKWAPISPSANGRFLFKGG